MDSPIWRGEAAHKFVSASKSRRPASVLWSMAVATAYALGFAVLSLPAEERAVGPSLTGEAALALAASRGDRKAFGRLVDLHKRSVYGLCLRLLRHPEDARDAAQEAFVRGYAALGTFDPTQPFAPWMLRIARNHCLDLARRAGSRPVEVALEAGLDEGGAGEVADPAATPADEALELRQQAGDLARAVAALPPNYREVVELFHVEHLSYKEIAQAMDVPLGTVMTWLHRARAQLRTSLGSSAAEGRP
jgi:RNA polymerase sigma-70 factor (ECF subfamily)